MMTPNRGDRREAMQRLLAGIEGMSFFSFSERLPSWDEIHDRTRSRLQRRR
jgi:hypothetical protein